MRRRQFTHFIALLAGGAAVSVHAAVPMVCKSVQSGAASNYLSRNFFETQLGNVFTVGRHEVRKLSLNAVESACRHNSREQFHAIFEVSPGTPLKEGIYVLESNNGPRMELFMTRSERGTTRQQMVATINLQTVA